MTQVARYKRALRPGRYRSASDAPALESAARAPWSYKQNMFGPYLTGANLTGINVDSSTALCLAAAFACVRVVSTDLATMPLELVQVDSDGGVRKATDDPRYKLFARTPDGNTIPMRSVQTVVGHLLTAGQAFYGIETKGSFQAGVRLVLMDPRTTRVDWSLGGLAYSVNGRLVPKERIVHFAGLGYDGLTGYNPVSLAKQAIALAMVGENYAAGFTANGNKASGLLKTKHKYDPAAADELLDGFIGMVSGDNVGGVGLLPPDVDFVSLTVDPQKSQMIESRKFQLREMARLFGCPLNRIAEIDGYSYAGMEAENDLYVSTTLRPWASCIEQALNLRLLGDDEVGAGYEFRFDFSSRLRADTAARTAQYTGLFSVGAITQNEIRQREGLPRVDDPSADKLHTPLNMATQGGTDGVQA